MAKLQISFQLDSEDKVKLEQIAEEQDLSVSQVIRRALKEYIDKLNNK